jgi:succinate dehydrogenase / fumarate reductase cytochrome b subunit
MTTITTNMMTKIPPLSPHLQIYKLPFAALLSIAHRITGVFLTLGLAMLVYWLIAVARGGEAYASAQACLGSALGLLFLLGATFSLNYHLCNGIRHLFWDAGLGFDMNMVDTTGKAVLVAAAALTAITWAIGFSSGG